MWTCRRRRDREDRYQCEDDGEAIEREREGGDRLFASSESKAMREREGKRVV